MLPANQSLTAGKLRRIGLDIVFRLIEHFELPLFDRRAKIIEELLFQKFLFLHRLVIDHQWILIITAHFIACGVSAVEHESWLKGFLPVFHAHAQVDVNVGGNFRNGFLKPLQQCAIVILMEAVDIKAVCFIAACDAFRFPQEGTNLFTDHTQHDVTKVTAMECVDDVKLFDIHNDRIHVQFRMVGVDPVDIFKEEVAAVKTGKRIMFSSGNQLPSFT